MGKLTGTFSSAHCGSNGCTMNTDEGVACLSLWCPQLRLHCQLAACALGLEFIPRQYNLSCVLAFYTASAGVLIRMFLVWLRNVLQT